MEAVMKEFNEDQPSNANAWLWGDEVLSDVKLAFQNLAVGTTASAGAQGFHLHATVLCSSSLYFRTRITSAVGTSGSKRKRCEHLVEVVDAGQRRAAASLLRFFYTSQLLSIEDSCCSAKRLLQMMKLADRWQALLALAAISKLLCKLPAELFPTISVYALPAGLRLSESFAAVTSHAATSLLSVFGDATAIATTPSLLQRFLHLPHAVVLELLQSDALAADAEATVLLLLSEWCKDARNASRSEAEFRELSACIRYSRMSTPYLTEVYAHMHTPALTVAQTLELMYYRSVPEKAQADAAILMGLGNPSGWYMPARSAPSVPTTELLRVTLRVPEADLYLLLEATAAAMAQEGDGGEQHEAMRALTLRTEPVLSCGFIWTLKLEGSLNGGVFCGLMAAGVTGLLPEDETRPLKHCVMCDLRIDIVGRRASHDVTLLEEVDFPIDGNGVGRFLDTDVAAHMTPLERRWWRPYVVQRCVTFQAIVTKVS